MTNPADYPADAGEPSLSLKNLKQWGFSKDYSDLLQAHAAACEKLQGKKMGEIVTALGLASRSSIEAALKTKPANVLSLEHFVSVIPSLQEHTLRILAVSRAIPYLAVIPEAWVEAGVKLPGEARARLDELNAAYLMSPDALPFVVFSDLGGLLRFSQAGRLDKAQDPIRRNVMEPIGVALAPPTVVARAARNEGTKDNLRVVSSSLQDNYWAPQLAKTEGERILARLLDEAIARRATDLSFVPLRDGTSRAQFRLMGDITHPDRNEMLNPAITREITNFLVSKSRAGDGGRLRKAADGQLTYKNAQSEVFLRASFIPADRFGQDFDMVSTSVRLLPRTAKNISLDSLNLTDTVKIAIRKALLRTQGLIVVAGPTNSGKSTTIAGVVGEHVRTYGGAKKRLSLEDPVERHLEGITQISVEDNFAELVRALLRHDPDLIWVGEIRDAYSAAACVRAATSGHIVLSTVHANNSILAFRAIANYLRKDTGEATGGGASLFDLAESISLLVGQRLAKRLCPHCRQPHKVSETDIDLAKSYFESEGHSGMWERTEEILRKGVFKANPKGCKACSDTGYAGEIPLNELLPASREVRELFAKSETRLDMVALSKHRVNTLTGSAVDLLARSEVEFSALFI